MYAGLRTSDTLHKKLCHIGPARCVVELYPSASCGVGCSVASREPAVCNLDGVAAVLACHADFWYLIGGLGHFLNVMYFPKYPILIAVIVRAPQGCEPGFLFHCHSPSLLYEDCCRTSVCANHPTVRKGCSLLLLSRGELIARPDALSPLSAMSIPSTVLALSGWGYAELRLNGVLGSCVSPSTPSHWARRST